MAYLSKEVEEREPHKLSRGTNDALDKATPARLRAFRPVRVDPEHVQVYPPVLFFFLICLCK